MSECPRECARTASSASLNAGMLWSDGQRSVVLVCNVCGYKAVEPRRPARDVRVSEHQEEVDNMRLFYEGFVDAIEAETLAPWRDAHDRPLFWCGRLIPRRGRRYVDRYVSW